jgi:hypothetical protein
MRQVQRERRKNRYRRIGPTGAKYGQLPNDVGGAVRGVTQLTYTGARSAFPGKELTHQIG